MRDRPALVTVRTRAAASTGEIDKDNAMAGNVTVIEHKSRQNAHGDARSASRRVSTLLACCLLVASLLALYEVAQLRQPSSNAANSSRSIQTIRSFYAGLDEFMETGEANAVSKTLAPGALAFVPEAGILGQDSGLLTYLMALRSTSPKLRFTVEQIDAGDDIAIATVRRSGAVDLTTLGVPSASGLSQEFFRVRDQRIVQHWTTAPAPCCSTRLPANPCLSRSSSPVIWPSPILTFSPNQHVPHLVAGPALVLVQSGRLSLTGDGSSQILDMVTGATAMPELNESATAGPGQAILIPERRALRVERAPEMVTARIATLVEDPNRNPWRYPQDRHPPPPPLNDLSILDAEHATVSGAATIRPLAFDDRSIPNGTWKLEIAWAVLGPGASLPLRLPANGHRFKSYPVPRRP